MMENNINITTSCGSSISTEYNDLIKINRVVYYEIKLSSVNQDLFRFSERSGVVIDDMCSTKLYCTDASEVYAIACLKSSRNSKMKPGFFYIKKSDVLISK